MKLLLALASAVAALSPATPPPPRPTRLGSSASPYELGERTRVRLVAGGETRKLRKKQRRSRSPVLYPCRTAGGADAWLQVPATRSHVLERGRDADIPAFVSRVEADGDQDVLVLTPTPAALRHRSHEDTAPNGGRRLDELRTNDAVEATVLRLLSRDAALVAARNVYRRVTGGFKRQAAILPDAAGLAVGDVVECHVKLAEPQSGRLTVSRAPVARGDLKRAKTEARLRKQLKRGSLAVGKARVATVAAVDGATLRVDAGGIAATCAAPEAEGPFAPGDRVMTRVVALDEATLEATLEYVAVGEMYEDGAEEAEA